MEHYASISAMLCGDVKNSTLGSDFAASLCIFIHTPTQKKSPRDKEI